VLGRIPIWRHLVLAVVVVVLSVLGFAGVIGAGNHPERFDAKLVIVRPSGADGVRITEVVDQDFGSNDRHGYQRIIPNDFGVPTDIEASSPDANADVHVIHGVSDTTIRLGDPDKTVDGQHRYVLSYTLPEAQISTRQLALDIIGNDETLETKTFTVEVAGMELEDPTCNVGSFGTSGGCTLERDGDVYRAVISPLRPGEGITIGGTIVSTDPNVDIGELPPVPARRSSNHVPVGLALLGGGAVAVVAVFLVIRRLGSNEVAAGGAADAAYASGAPGSVRMVADDRMAALATTEFVPPPGVQPWQGNVLLREQIGTDSVSAWFSGLVAREAIVLDDAHKPATMARGPKFAGADPQTQALLAPVIGQSPVALGTYQPQFAALWRQITRLQVSEIAGSGWWRRRPPGSAGSGGPLVAARFGAMVVVFVVFAGGGIVRSNVLNSAPAAIVGGIAVATLLAMAMYWYLLRSRSAVGSGLAIRTESFRRFLVASEGQHVDWAWEHGVLREYSAWAVALGAADAWSRAISESHVPPAEVHVGNPLLVYALASSFASTHVAPSTSGSSGGGFSGGGFGGFSGGSVGGGGGGGSSGSW
jgi:hypothetical protein